MSELSLNSLLAVPLAPLVGSIAAGLFGKVIGRKGAHTVTILGVLISFILSAMTLQAVMDGASFNQTVAVIFLAFISYLALKEYLSLIPTRRIDRAILLFAYLARGRGLQANEVVSCPL